MLEIFTFPLISKSKLEFGIFCHKVHNLLKGNFNLFMDVLLSVTQFKVERILNGSLDLIPSPSLSVKIQIWVGKFA